MRVQLRFHEPESSVSQGQSLNACLMNSNASSALLGFRLEAGTARVTVACKRS